MERVAPDGLDHFRESAQINIIKSIYYTREEAVRWDGPKKKTKRGFVHATGKVWHAEKWPILTSDKWEHCRHPSQESRY